MPQMRYNPESIQRVVARMILDTRGLRGERELERRQP